MSMAMVLTMMSLEVVGHHVCCYAEEKEKTQIVRLLDTGFPGRNPTDG
jgi:hypothetical protein